MSFGVSERASERVGKFTQAGKHIRRTGEVSVLRARGVVHHSFEYVFNPQER